MKLILIPAATCCLALCAIHAASAQQTRRPYRLSSVDLKQRVIWGSELRFRDGSGLAFGGQDQDADDGRPHTRVLVDGQWQHGNKTVDIGVTKIKRGGEHIMQADNDGDRAISHFEPIEVFQNCSLMKVTIETGRTHQIRVHALQCQHPIVGDSKYGNKKTNQAFRKLGLKRLFLHAARLYLPLQDPITINAELSHDLDALLQHLRST